MARKGFKGRGHAGKWDKTCMLTVAMHKMGPRVIFMLFNSMTMNPLPVSGEYFFQRDVQN